jgi:hypothetical protein
MKRLAPALAVLAVLLLAFAGLRVYGFYHNEQADALHRAEAALDEAKRLEDLAREEDLRSKCDLQWSEYGLEEKKAELVRLRQGEIAYLKAKARLIDQKPLCSGYAMSMSDSLQLSFEKLEHSTKAIDLQEYAKVQTSYATDRKQQTKRLLHKVWASLTGQKDWRL